MWLRSRLSKLIAAWLLTFALALFPLSGNRVLAAPVHAHASTSGETHTQTGTSGAHADHAHAIHDHGHADHDAVAGKGASGCGPHDGQSSCCSLSCHAMVTQDPVATPAWTALTSPLDPVAMPLPRGSRSGGLLRPPRPA
jgi:hypothetical protein